MANFNANTSANANGRTEFMSFKDKFNSTFKGSNYVFRTVTTRRADPNDPNSARVACEPYRILMFRKDGKLLDFNGNPVDSQDQAAVFKLGQNTSANVDYTDFDWSWIVAHKDTLQVGETVSQNGLHGYSLCLSTEISEVATEL
jgi:hypothetical protein